MSQNQPLVPNVRERVASLLMLGIHSKTTPNPNAASTKRAHDGVCNFCKQVVAGKVEDLRKHAATCSESNPDAKLAARIQQIRVGGGSATSSQMSIASYTDKHKLSASQNKVMQRLLLLALIMGGIQFASVANLQFQHFLHCLRPSFVPPGTATSCCFSFASAEVKSQAVPCLQGKLFCVAHCWMVSMARFLYSMLHGLQMKSWQNT